jgi:hypothetical protein
MNVEELTKHIGRMKSHSYEQSYYLWKKETDTIRVRNTMLVCLLPDEQQRSNESSINLTCPQSIIRNIFGQESTVGTSLIQYIIGFGHHAVRTKKMIEDDLLRIMTMVKMTSVLSTSIESEVLRVKENVLNFNRLRDKIILNLRTIAQSPSLSSPSNQHHLHPHYRYCSCENITLLPKLSKE